MNIDERDIIVLSDDITYMVAKKINYNNINYYCIIDVENKENIKYLYEDNNELVEIEDPQTFDNVLIEMAKTTDMTKLLEILKRNLTEQNQN